MSARAHAALLALGAALLLAAPAAAQTPVGTPADPLIRRGFHLYGQYCLSCHGPNGQGRLPSPGDAAGFGPERPESRQAGYGPPLRGVGALSADFYLRTGYMPLPRVGEQPRRRGVLRLTEEEIEALVAYVAWLGEGPPIPEPNPARGDLSEGQRLFTTHCAGCHQVVAQGGYVTDAVPPPLEDATAVQIAQAVRIGPYVMPRFSEARISDEQLDSIIAYVQWTKDARHDGGWPLGYLGPVPEGLVTWFVAAAALVAVCVVIGKRLKT